jgi:YfiH family protein
MKQVHSDGLIIDMPDIAYPQEADALMTDERGVFLVVKTADCVPVFLLDRDCRAIGLVHAGRRSAGMGLLPKTIAAMRTAYGVLPADLTVCIGPCIRAHNYEVKADVYDDPVFAPYCRPFAEKTVLDLAALLHAQLAEAGVRDVRDCGWCTFDDDERCYSYRRGDGEHRILSFAVIA